MMNALHGIWIVMRLVSYALFAFVLAFAVGGNSLGDTVHAIATFDLDVLLASPWAAAICFALWLVWAIASWRFLFGK
jgi:hypothetical protein